MFRFLPTSMLKICVCIISLGFLTACQTTKQQIPIPDDVDGGRASPWNFYEDFSAKSLASYRLTKKFGKTDRSLYEFVDVDGDTALAITVKHGSHPNDGKHGTFDTERAEVAMAFGKSARGKEVWWGFRVLASSGFEAIDDRLLFTQMKHQHTEHGNPVVGLHTFEGMAMKIDGASRAKSVKLEDAEWYGVAYDYDRSVDELLNKPDWFDVRPKWRSKHDGYTKFSPQMRPAYNKKEWTDYVVGVYTSGRDSWVKVVQNGREIYRFEGSLGEFAGYGRMNESVIRIGIYRDTNPSGEYPDQTLIFDDFVVASSEADVVAMLRKSCRATMTCLQVASEKNKNETVLPGN